MLKPALLAYDQKLMMTMLMLLLIFIMMPKDYHQVRCRSAAILNKQYKLWRQQQQGKEKQSSKFSISFLILF